MTVTFNNFFHFYDEKSFSSPVTLHDNVLQTTDTNPLINQNAEPKLKTPQLDEVISEKSAKDTYIMLKIQKVLGQAEVYYERGRFYKAFKKYRTILKIQPECLIALKKIAEIYLRARDLMQALKIAQKIQSHDPLDFDAAKTIGFILHSVPVYNILIEEGKRHYSANEIFRAYECFKRAKAIDEHHPQAWFGLAAVHYTGGSKTDGDFYNKTALDLKLDQIKLQKKIHKKLLLTIES